ncbi:uncharacterized protein C8Q71DRAFT_332963 [Rhodofomes roseus]|uniref:Transcription factor CBF/NF-Y/archaeal histone domain-containing protein n=1 Tax=Rhodofomes roseus TaxID=34475 RepID=A0ABQ8KT75_9APHY|nr:uncharacterized protein C8Q71DRAFT_332963 [Rhodofomes roseus]KAH9841497.1 hypothetical protein C8Q71DRAFT_332963 [Rhodofomes roseus]
MSDNSAHMSPPDSPDVPLAGLEEDDGTQSEPIDVPDDLQNDEEEEETQEGETRGQGETATRDKESRKREKVVFDAKRQPGKTHLPIARVRKVLKADRELPMVQKDAAFLFAAAAEEFTMRLAAAVDRVVHRDNRLTAQYKDVVSLSRRDEFVFMDEIIASIPSSQAKRKVKDLVVDDKEGKRKKKKVGPMDKFLGAKKGSDEADDAQDESEAQVTMNEDGTMSMSLE